MKKTIEKDRGMELFMEEKDMNQKRKPDDLEEQENQLLRTYIEQKTAAYILDEARSIGMPEPSVSVKVKWGDERSYDTRRDYRRTAIPPERLSCRGAGYSGGKAALDR